MGTRHLYWILTSPSFAGIAVQGKKEEEKYDARLRKENETRTGKRKERKG